MFRTTSCCGCVDHLEGAKAIGVALSGAAAVAAAHALIFASPSHISPYAVAGLYAVAAISSAGLVHGALKRKRVYLLPWLVIHALGLLFYAGANVYVGVADKDGGAFFKVGIVGECFADHSSLCVLH